MLSNLDAIHEKQICFAIWPKEPIGKILLLLQEFQVATKNLAT
jgi:hypothetical protein